MSPVSTRYVLRHLDHLLEALAVPPPARLLEVGAGMGRFSLRLAERGYRVTAVDLSPDLLERLQENARGIATGRGSVAAICCNASEVAAEAPGPYDAAAGFFFLHHLPSVRSLARGVARVLAPGARVAFCEPNAFNPAFYLQVLLTPGMTWEGEKGIARMRPGVLLPAFAEAGFEDLAIERYGLFPPALANRRAGAAVEELLERLPPLAPVLAFQVLSGTFRG
jgi:SAM-dependent methyltransferase